MCPKDTNAPASTHHRSNIFNSDKYFYNNNFILKKLDVNIKNMLTQQEPHF